MSEIEYTPDQFLAYLNLTSFLSSKEGGIFILTGFSGTGKTTLLKKIKNDFLLTKNYTVLYTAPTNKAAKIMTKMLNTQASTIFSALRIVLDIDHKTGGQKLTFPNPVYIPNKNGRFVDIIFIDECSMISKELLNYIRKHYSHLKLVFIGDPAQLPPVNEVISPVFALLNNKDVNSSHLSQVMRHDNQILTLATALRKAVEENTIPTIKNDNDTDEGIFKLDNHHLIEVIKAYSSTEDFMDPDEVKVLAWRNFKVNQYNELIRRNLFGKESRDKWIIGDQIMMAAPLIRDSVNLLTVDDEGFIVNRAIVKHPRRPQYMCYELEAEFDRGSHRLYVLHESSQELYKAKLNELAENAKKNKKTAKYFWEDFWALKQSFEEIRYGYAITAHRSQGSSYKNVIVDVEDILANKNQNEALRCLYVAISRASERVFVN